MANIIFLFKNIEKEFSKEHLGKNIKTFHTFATAGGLTSALLLSVDKFAVIAA